MPERDPGDAARPGAGATTRYSQTRAAETSANTARNLLRRGTFWPPNHRGRAWQRRRSGRRVGNCWSGDGGDALQGTSRFRGALFGNSGAAAARAHNAPEAVIRRATSGTTDAERQAAQHLQDNNFGIDLSSPESLAQARAGASKLRDILRVVEGSPTGGKYHGPVFRRAPRPSRYGCRRRARPDRAATPAAIDAWPCSGGSCQPRGRSDAPGHQRADQAALPGGRTADHPAGRFRTDRPPIRVSQRRSRPTTPACRIIRSPS